MRKRQTFMLTVLTSGPEENIPGDCCGPTSVVGQLKVISSGKAVRFSSLEELVSLISDEMEQAGAVREAPPRTVPEM